MSKKKEYYYKIDLMEKMASNWVLYALSGESSFLILKSILIYKGGTINEKG